MAYLFRQTILKSGHDEARRSCPTFGERVLSKMNEYRKRNQMCDVTLVAGEEPEQREFPAHRGVLSAGSVFFEWYGSGMREENEHEVKIPQIQPSVVEHILNYLYTGEVKLTKGNCAEILKAADFLLIERLKKMACDVLELQLNLSNCVFVFILADTYSCDELKEQALRVMQEGFEQVCKTEPFLALTFAQLEQILSQKVKVDKQETMFEALVYWVRHDSVREKHFPKLFTYIQLTIVDKDYLQSKIACEDLVKTNNSCLQQLSKRENVEHQSDTVEVMLHLKVKYMQDANAHVISRVYWDPDKSIQYEKESLHKCPNNWPTVSNDVEPLILSHNETVYILHQPGWELGLDEHIEESQQLRRFESYNTITGTFRELTPPPKDVGECGAVIHVGCIYVVGGHTNSSESCETVQRYDISQDTWDEVAPMNHTRAYVVVVSDGKYLYAMGDGPGDFDCTEPESVEMYDPEANSWSILPPLGEKEEETFPLDAVSVDGYIFVTCSSYIDMKTDSTINWLTPKSMLIFSCFAKKWFDVTDNMKKILVDKFFIDRIVKFDNKVYFCCKEHGTKQHYLLHWDLGNDDWCLRSCRPSTLHTSDEIWCSPMLRVSVSRTFLQSCVITV